MAALKHFALGCCILCAMAGILHVFWPDNSFKPVINTVLLLYILTTAIGLGQKTNWQQFEQSFSGWNETAQSGSAAYSDYAQSLGLQSAAQALQSVLLQNGIEAEVTLENDLCTVTLRHAQDTAAAQKIVDQNRGSLSCVIKTEGDAP